MQDKKNISSLIIGLVVVGLFVVAAPIFAQTNPGGSGFGKGMGRGIGQMQRPSVFGTVSAINGNSLTVTSTRGFGSSASAGTTYTVDATNAKITKNNVAGTVASIAVGDTIMVQGTVSGTSVVAKTIRDGVVPSGVGARGGMGVGGTVASINGTTLTVTTKARTMGAKTTPAATYTVDASSATVTKNGTASSVSAVAVGDTVRVQGTVSGTNVTAKTIMDGVGQQQPVIQGNGQPVVAGSVTAISGNTITITNKSNVTYTVDVTNAKIVENGIASPTISNVVVGDNVVIQGTVSGSSVTASSVIDQKTKAGDNGNNPGNSKPKQGFMGGMMQGIGNFFKHLFGF